MQPDRSYLPVAFAGANVFVDEWRAEALITRGWPLATGLTVQATLGGEYSRLRQAGPDGQTRTFWRPKGSAALTWTATPRMTVNAELRRNVGQLSFFDFTASVDLQNNNATAGNRQIVPEQSWRAAMRVTRSLGAAGSLTLGGYHEWITDIVDAIPLSATEEGIGNLPSARRWGLTFSGTIVFDSLGWQGVRLTASGEIRDSSVRDPVTGATRRISEDLVRTANVELRHDIPGTELAWGAELFTERYAPFFRLDEVSSSVFSEPITTVFVEHKDVFGLTVRLALRNVLNGADMSRRDIYVARRNGPIESRERQTRNIFPFIGLSINGSF